MASKAQIARDMAFKALGGERTEGPFDVSVLRGLQALQGARAMCRLGIAAMATPRSGVVRCRLKGARRVVFYIAPRRYSNAPLKANSGRIIRHRSEHLDHDTVFTIIPRPGAKPLHYSHNWVALPGAQRLIDACKGSPTMGAKLVNAIERARKRCFQLAELSTRWL